MVAAGGALVAVVLGSGRFTCGFVRLFHLPCPSCGTTRAVWALLGLDLATALRMNPLAPLVVFALAAIGLRAVYVTARDGGVDRLGDRPWGYGALVLLASSLVLQIVVWALRFAGLFGGPVPT